MAFERQKQSYSKEETPFVPLLTEDDGFVEYRALRAQSVWPKRILLIGVLFFISGLCSLAASIVVVMRATVLDGTLRQMTYFSSVTNSLNPDWSAQQFRTHPIDAPESILRQPPSAEVDTEWQRLTDFGVLTISSDDVRHLGKDPDSVVRAPSEWGRGEDAYLAQLNGVHLLHCLDSMRKSLYHNFKYYHPHGIDNFVYHSHLSHCQEALAKHLTCQPSVELITFSWVERQRRPFPDFDITRKCWDYEALLEWQMENRVTSMNMEKWKALRPASGTQLLPIPLLMLEAYNMTRDEAEHMH